MDWIGGALEADLGRKGGLAPAKEEPGEEGRLGGSDSTLLDRPLPKQGQVKGSALLAHQECSGWPHPARVSCSYWLRRRAPSPAWAWRDPLERPLTRRGRRPGVTQGSSL